MSAAVEEHDDGWFVEQVKAGHSYMTIALALGCSVHAVQRRASKLGVGTMPRLTPEKRAAVIELRRQHVPVAEVAQRTGVSIRSVIYIAAAEKVRTQDAWSRETLIELAKQHLAPLPPANVRMSDDQRRARVAKLAEALKISVGATIQVIRRHKISRWIYGLDQEPQELEKPIEEGGWTPPSL